MNLNSNKSSKPFIYTIVYLSCVAALAVCLPIYFRSEPEPHCPTPPIQWTGANAQTIPINNSTLHFMIPPKYILTINDHKVNSKIDRAELVGVIHSEPKDGALNRERILVYSLIQVVPVVDMLSYFSIGSDPIEGGGFRLMDQTAKNINGVTLLAQQYDVGVITRQESEGDVTYKYEADPRKADFAKFKQYRYIVPGDGMTLFFVSHGNLADDCKIERRNKFLDAVAATVLIS